jgi:hypothetical protein
MVVNNKDETKPSWRFTTAQVRLRHDWLTSHHVTVQLRHRGTVGSLSPPAVTLGFFWAE